MSKTESNITHYVSAFANDTEQQIWQLPIEHFVLTEFQKEFKIPDPGNPMYDCYPIQESNLPFLEKHINNHYGWDFAAMSYFVHASAT